MTRFEPSGCSLRWSRTPCSRAKSASSKAAKWRAPPRVRRRRWRRKMPTIATNERAEPAAPGRGRKARRQPRAAPQSERAAGRAACLEFRGGDMAEVSAAVVRELRDKTGAGMMDCKKALAEVGGVMERAVDWLRTKGLA